MRKAKVYMHGVLVGQLLKLKKEQVYRFEYRSAYDGLPGF